jgi:hypothetical protein
MDAGSEQEGAPGGFGASGTEPDWAAVRVAYEGEEPLDSIRGRFGLSFWQLWTAPDRFGWVKRRPFGVHGGLHGIRPGPAPREMALRLYRIADTRIRRLEKRLEENGELSETDARAMTELVRTLERMMKLDEGQAKARAAKGGRVTDTKDASDDAAWMRAELKRRLARLGPEPGTPKVPGGGVRGDAD